MRRRSPQATSTSTTGTIEAPRLLDWIPRVSPHLAAPTWLAPAAEAFERASRESVRVLLSTPPQHGKSTLADHAIAWTLRYSSKQILYLTYNEDFATSRMRIARVTAEDARVPFQSGAQGIREWRTTLGGSLYATGVGGSVTGRPGGLVIIDDPIKDWVSAQSIRMRDAVDDWLRSVVMTRLHPDSSVVLIQTRWHPDDIYGRLARAGGWEAINLPALTDGDTRALWPEGRPVEWLLRQRDAMGLAMFSALYQGEPRARGGEVFGDPELVDDVPTVGRVAIGVDLAYSRRTSADYSVAVVMRRRANESCATVIDLVRKQVRAPEFAVALRALANEYPGAPMRAYLSGTERGAADFISREVPLEALPATSDKYVRAQPLAAAWNRGDVLIPRRASWASTLIEEMTSFTGSDDPHDDIVDAMAAAWDALDAAPSSVETIPHHTRRAVRGMRGVY